VQADDGLVDQLKMILIEGEANQTIQVGLSGRCVGSPNDLAVRNEIIVTILRTGLLAGVRILGDVVVATGEIRGRKGDADAAGGLHIAFGQILGLDSVTDTLGDFFDLGSVLLGGEDGEAVIPKAGQDVLVGCYGT
jgi:hypothetical protein